jgi:hypothetical protein
MLVLMYVYNYSYSFNKNDKSEYRFFCTSGKLDMGFLCRMYHVGGQKTRFVALVTGRCRLEVGTNLQQRRTKVCQQQICRREGTHTKSTPAYNVNRQNKKNIKTHKFLQTRTKQTSHESCHRVGGVHNTFAATLVPSSFAPDRTSARTKARRYQALFGVSAATCSRLWALVKPSLPSSAGPRHLLWTLYFLKQHGHEEVNAVGRTD